MVGTLRFATLQTTDSPCYALPLRAGTSTQFHGAIANHSKIDPADQIRTEHLGGADGIRRLPQRTDIRSERYDAAEHRGDRPEGDDLAGPEQAEYHHEQQGCAAGDGRLGSQNDLSASLRDFGKLL